MINSLEGINKRALKDAGHKFGGLYRLLNYDSLLWAFGKLNRKAAVGVDGVTYREYGRNLEDNLKSLVERLRTKTYKAQLIRRKYIPKSPGKFRPLGIPALEDKIVQYASSKILEAIYEVDFIEHSYGYRPGKSALEATDELHKAANKGPYSWVVEADIKGFFDNINHDWLIRMLEQRVSDKAFTRLIRKWLKAGILENETVLHPQTGTPQGGIISPILANIYLHYCLDLWVEKIVEPQSSGRVKIIRYADDFVCLFQRKSDATRFYANLGQRMTKFNLELAPDKTKLFSFSRFKSGKQNERFDFLGFEYSWGTSRKGKACVKKRTARKKFRSSIAAFSSWIRRNRSNHTSTLMKAARRKLIGHCNYFGVRGNSKSLSQIHHVWSGLLFKWLNRRSQKRSYTWDQFYAVAGRHRWQLPRMKDRKPKQLELGLVW